MSSLYLSLRINIDGIYIYVYKKSLIMFILDSASIYPERLFLLVRCLPETKHTIKGQENVLRAGP